MLKRLCLIILLFTPHFGANAQENQNLEPLISAMQLHRVLDVMHTEGVAYGADLDREMLEGAGGATWQKMVSDIYQPDRIWRTFLPRFTTLLIEQDTTAMTAFFASDLGQRITTLELEARNVMLDKARDKDSREKYHAMIEDTDPRLLLLKQLIEVNDLVEFNVMGAMNASLAFYSGLRQGNALGADLTQDIILKNVWSQEAEIRLDTEEWIYSYSLLAYGALTDAELQMYIEFSDSGAGRALNAALFAGYDDVFTAVSKALGLSVAHIMQNEAL